MSCDSSLEKLDMKVLPLSLDDCLWKSVGAPDMLKERCATPAESTVGNSGYALDNRPLL